MSHYIINVTLEDIHKTLLNELPRILAVDNGVGVNAPSHSSSDGSYRTAGAKSANVGAVVASITGIVVIVAILVAITVRCRRVLLIPASKPTKESKSNTDDHDNNQCGDSIDLKNCSSEDRQHTQPDDAITYREASLTSPVIASVPAECYGEFSLALSTLCKVMTEYVTCNAMDENATCLYK